MFTCRMMKHFSPSTNDCVMTRVRFSKCLYAMLSKPKYFPDKRSGWKIPPDTDPTHKASELGMKLTCGFEMLAAQAEKRNSSHPDLPDSVNSGQKFDRFVKKLGQTGYFQVLVLPKIGLG